jgi:hypothetical protein
MIMALPKRNSVKKSVTEDAESTKVDPVVVDESTVEQEPEVATKKVKEPVAEKAEAEEAEVAEETPEEDTSEVNTNAEDTSEEEEEEHTGEVIEGGEDEIYPATVDHPAAQAPALTPAAAITASPGNALQELAAEGAEGLKIDWTSFPTIVLDKGEFCTSDGAELDTEAFDVSIVQTRTKFALASTHEDEDDQEVAYTYDLDELNDPTSKVAEMVAKWKDEDEVDYTVKEYLDAICIIIDPDLAEEVGEIATLQIPPTSVGKLSGHIHGVKLTRKLVLGTYITKVKRGSKISKTKHAFYPWAFKFVSPRD